MNEAIQLGEPYTFRWFDRELTGVAIRKVNNEYITLRTSTATFVVPKSDIVEKIERTKS